MDWVMMPVTEAEVGKLGKEAEVEGRGSKKIAPGRRSLGLAHPTGAEQRVYWSEGIRVLWHD